MQTFWYALYTSTTVTSGSAYANYGNPVQVEGNISAARGATVMRQFGDDAQYDRVILMEDRDTPINEYAVLWIDNPPDVNANGALKTNQDGTYKTPPNYVVRKVGRGLPTFGNAVIAANLVTVR